MVGVPTTQGRTPATHRRHHDDHQQEEKRNPPDRDASRSASKLYVAAAGEGAVLDYDRGWITRASTAEAKAILKAILKEFN